MKIDIEKMSYIVTGVYVRGLYFGESTYENLFEQVETYRLSGTVFDTDIHNIDELMVDAYKLYAEIKELKEIDSLPQEIFSGLANFGIKMNLDDVQMVSHNFISIFDEIMINCTFEGVQIRGIQKNFLGDKLNDAISDEEFEKAAYIRDKIKSII